MYFLIFRLFICHSFCFIVLVVRRTVCIFVFSPNCSRRPHLKEYLTSMTLQVIVTSNNPTKFQSSVSTSIFSCCHTSSFLHIMVTVCERYTSCLDNPRDYPRIAARDPLTGNHFSLTSFTLTCKTHPRKFMDTCKFTV